MNSTKLSLTFALAFGLLVSPFGVAAQIPGSPNRGQGTADSEQYKIERKDVIRKTDLEQNVRVNASVQVQDKKIASTTLKRIEGLKENKAKMNLTIDARKKEIGLRLKAQLSTSTASSTKKLDVNAKARVRQHIENIYKRLSHHLDMAVEVDGKIAARLTLMSENGIDTNAAETQFKKAQEALEKAKADVAATKSLASDQTATTTASVSKDALKNLVKTAEESIKAAVKEYRATIEIMRLDVKSSINSSEQGALRSSKIGSSTVETETTASTTVSQ